MAFDKPTEGAVINAADINGVFTTLYADASAATEEDVADYALDRTHLPTPMVTVNTKTSVNAGPHLYTSAAYPYDGYATGTTFIPVGTTLGVPDSMEVILGTSLTFTSGSVASFAGYVEVFATIMCISLDLGWAVFALQWFDGASWNFIAETERIIDTIAATNAPIDMNFLLPGSLFSGSTMSRVRVVVAVSDGAAAGPATLTLEDFSLAVYGVRAGVFG